MASTYRKIHKKNQQDCPQFTANLQYINHSRFENGFTLIFTIEFRNYLNILSTPISLKTCSKLNLLCQRSIPKRYTKNLPSLFKIPRTWLFHVVVLQRTTKKCTKNYNARAQPLLCSLNLLFSDVAVAVVVFLSSLFVPFFVLLFFFICLFLVR